METLRRDLRHGFDAPRAQREFFLELQQRQDLDSRTAAQRPGFCGIRQCDKSVVAVVKETMAKRFRPGENAWGESSGSGIREVEMSDWDRYMQEAIREAELSLREGNSGFGALVVKDDAVVARSHDTDRTDNDPTAHAELTAIRKAAALLGGSLSGCTIVSTHEPCPMCAAAIIWSGASRVCYGYSIEEAIRQGRRRIPLSCRELFRRAEACIAIEEGVFHDQCAVLYDRRVREQVSLLRNADAVAMRAISDELTSRRLAWSERRQPNASEGDGDVVGAAYELLLDRLGVVSEEAPILDRGATHLRFASRNFCPTLEACRILGLDTRVVCKELTERPTNELIRQLDPRLRFDRNYDHLRPYCDYCEEIISLG